MRPSWETQARLCEREEAEQHMVSIMVFKVYPFLLNVDKSVQDRYML